MAQIPNDQKFHTLSANTPTVERGSAQADALREIYTMQDIIDSVSFGSGVASLDGLTGVVNLSGAGAVTVSNNGSDTITITGDAGVETLNSLVGGVTLFAGAGVTITDNGSDTITIASTGGSGTKLDGQNIEYEVSATALSADGDFEGMVAKVGDAGNTLTVGNVYYWNGTQNDWVAADNTAEGTAKGIMGIALGTSGTADGVLLSGVYYYGTPPGSAAGDVLYLSTSGDMTETAPTTTGDFLRVLGQRLDANRVMFMPSQDFVEIGTSDLDDLTDVTITGTPGAGEILINNATTGQFVNSTLTAGTNVTITEADGSVTIAATGTGGATDLDGLTDVTITGTPGDGQLLISQTDGTFVNTTLSAGSSGFVRITNASGQVTIGAGDGTEVEYLVRSTAVSSAGDVEGNIVKFGTTTGMTAGDVYVWNGTNWVQVDGDADITTKGLMGVALGASSADDGLLTHGVAYLSHNPGTAGDILYVDTLTAGYLTATQPSAQGDFVRVAGYCLADNKVFFSPSQDFIEIA